MAAAISENGNEPPKNENEYFGKNFDLEKQHVKITHTSTTNFADVALLLYAATCCSAP